MVVDKAAFLGYRPLGSLFIRSSLFHEKERSGFSSDARLHLSLSLSFPFTHSVPIFVLSKAALTQRSTTERVPGTSGRELLDHRRGSSDEWMLQHPNSDCQTRRDSLSLFLLHKSQLHLEYRTDGSADDDRPSTVTLSPLSLVRIETELLNRAQAAARAGAEDGGKRGVCLTALVALPLAQSRPAAVAGEASS